VTARSNATRERPGPGGSLRSDAVLLAVTFVWGTTFVVVHQAVATVPPLLFVALRFTVASIVLAPWVLGRYGLPDWTCIRAGVIVGVWLFLGFGLQTAGLVETTPARAAFITGLAVVLVPPFLILFYRRKPSAASLVGVALATVGLGLLTGMSGGGFGRGDLLVLGCAAAFAMQILAVDRYTVSIGPARLLLVELFTVAALAWPATLLFEPGRSGTAGMAWGAIVFTALVATLGALWGQNWAQQRTPPTRAGVILTMEPVFAAAYSYLAIGERLGWTAILGSALILAGMLAAELLPGRRDGLRRTGA
jgi:drug/metabolite transporter (DMT)-like permease